LREVPSIDPIREVEGVHEQREPLGALAALAFEVANTTESAPAG
jgi:hypothetical protein